MRANCYGCRALRKGCRDGCTIRPSLEWLDTPEAQANATVFLAKFYGRTGLLNLLAAVPDDQARPKVFRSLLYEACGRIVSPVGGSVGLLESGKWQLCQDAFEAVLKGEPIIVQVQVDNDAAAAPPEAAAYAYDIRHVAKDPDADAVSGLLLFARAGRRLSKRAGSSSTSSTKAKRSVKGKPSDNERASPSPPPLGQQQQEEAAEETEPVPVVVELIEHDVGRDLESAGHHLLLASKEDNTDLEAGSHVSQAKAQGLVADQGQESAGLDLELTLGVGSVVRKQPRSSSCDQTGSSLIDLRLHLPA